MFSISRLHTAQTRSISAENPTGAKGGGAQAAEGISAVAARALGKGWKVSPAIALPAGDTATIASVDGPGVIQHIWMTVAAKFWRILVLRFYWDGEDAPSIEVPFGDLFCNGWGTFAPVNSLPVVAAPVGGFNSYWEMPFRRSVRITVENLSGEDIEAFFYQITYARTDVPDDCAYLHAQWRRSNPVTGGIHTLLDGVHGQGHYVGTYLAWGVNNGGWWGEGEVKFYLDGDDEYPTICGTGTEDYFGGAWEFEYPKGQYGEYTSPYLGMPQVIRPDGFHVTQQRFGMYRWHLPDPVRFKESLRVTVQALGWRHPYAGKPTYLVLQDDIASTSWWYQTAPHAPFPRLPPVDQLEVI